MNRQQRIALVFTLVAAVAVLTAIGAVGAQAGTGENESVAPGEQLAGVVGVQNAELDGEVDQRSFQATLANADSDEKRAALIADRYERVSAELNSTEATLEELRDARDAGELTNGQYQAQVAVIGAQHGNAERAAGQMNETADGLPADVLEANGVNATAIETLRGNASELGGQEVAEIAQSIGGPPADRPGAGGPPAETDAGGPPAEPGNDQDDETTPADDSSGNDTAQGGPEDDRPAPPGDGGPANR